MAQAVLMNILSRNQNTEIGKIWNFKDIANVDEYREAVPLTTYEDYKLYIKRMTEKGETNILTVEEINQFAPSSGTTGEMKLFPVVAVPSPRPIFAESPPSDGKTLFLANTPEDVATPSGLPIRAISAVQIYNEFQTTPEYFAVPAATVTLRPLSTALYVQLVFGLKCTSTHSICSTFITTMLTSIGILRAKGLQMCEDISKGRLDATLRINKEQRTTLEKLLGEPDPKHAKALELTFKEAEREDFKSIIPRLWPRVTLVKSFCSGNLASYIPILRHYTGPGIHILSNGYACSEGLIGLPAKPQEKTSIFFLYPRHVFEFIPFEDSHQDQPKTLLQNELQEGKIYEIVMTTPVGLYRYRNGDYIKVLEMGEEGPLIDFYGRKKMFITLRGHKLFEGVLDNAMTVINAKATSRIDYMASLDEDHVHNRYKVWIEYCDGALSDLDGPGLGRCLDEQLQQVDQVYRYLRSSEKIDELFVQRVKGGTFAAILSHIEGHTAVGESQIKLPRVIIKTEIMAILTESKM